VRSLINTDPAVREVALGTPQGFLAFGLGTGLSRYAPGTFGTLAAVPFAMLLKSLPVPAFWFVLVALFLLGIPLCNDTSRRLGQQDPGGIVWDEMVGFWLCVAFVPTAWTWWLAAFVLFRAFDIIKPWPISALEKRFGGGLGIMLDDIVAAVFAMAVLALAGALL
jgi:phosphatidylglycerophosphatase A